MANLMALAGALASLRDSLFALNDRVDDPDRDLLAAKHRIRANEQLKRIAALLAAGEDRDVDDGLVAAMLAISGQVSLANGTNMTAVDAALAATHAVLDESGPIVGEA